MCVYIYIYTKGHTISNQHRKEALQTQPPSEFNYFLWDCVHMAASIPAKFYCFMTTRTIRADTQSSKMKHLGGGGGPSCLKRSSKTSALIEMQSSSHAYLEANKMSFPVTCYTNIFSTVMFSRSSVTVSLKMRYFNYISIYCVQSLLFKTSSNIKLEIQRGRILWSILLWSNFICTDEVP
jgi:hypothetical protein